MYNKQGDFLCLKKTKLYKTNIMEYTQHVSGKEETYPKTMFSEPFNK